MQDPNSNRLIGLLAVSLTVGGDRSSTARIGRWSDATASSSTRTSLTFQRSDGRERIKSICLLGWPTGIVANVSSLTTCHIFPSSLSVRLLGSAFRSPASNAGYLGFSAAQALIAW